MAQRLCGTHGDGRQMCLVGAGVTIEGSQRFVFCCMGSRHFVQDPLMGSLQGGRDLPVRPVGTNI